MRYYLCILFLLFGCGGAAEAITGVDIAEAPKADCPNGGIVLNGGMDKNGNGTIDANEITSSEKVCNGVNGVNGVNGASPKLVTRWACWGKLGTNLIWYAYNYLYFSSGDVMVYGAITDTYFQIFGYEFYSSNDVGAEPGNLIIASDLEATANAGYWIINMNTATMIVTLEYHDMDLVGGVDVWSRPATDCTKYSY